MASARLLPGTQQGGQGRGTPPPGPWDSKTQVSPPAVKRPSVAWLLAAAGAGPAAGRRPYHPVARGEATLLTTTPAPRRFLAMAVPSTPFPSLW